MDTLYLYTVNAEFEKVFFEKAFFPSDPITSYSEEKFSEMLKLQTSEYTLPSPFTNADSMRCFLKPEGIVLSMPAIMLHLPHPLLLLVPLDA